MHVHMSGEIYTPPSRQVCAVNRAGAGEWSAATAFALTPNERHPEPLSPDLKFKNQIRPLNPSISIAGVRSESRGGRGVVGGDGVRPAALHPLDDLAA